MKVLMKLMGILEKFFEDFDEKKRISKYEKCNYCGRKSLEVIKLVSEKSNPLTFCYLVKCNMLHMEACNPVSSK